MKIIKDSPTSDLLVKALVEYKKYCNNQIELHKKNALTTNTQVLIDTLNNNLDDIVNANYILKQLGYVEKVYTFDSDDIPF